MKYLVKFFVVTFLLFNCTYTLAEQKITYIDLKFVLNNSKAGKGAQDFLRNSFKEKQKRFIDTEKELKKEEEKLIDSKKSLSKEEYKKRSDSLRKKVIKYQSDRKSGLEKITKQRADALAKLLSSIDPILIDYINKNDVSMVVDKKSIIAGKNNVDITNIVIEELNKALPSINLK